jgi:hypothetical protein
MVKSEEELERAQKLRKKARKRTRGPYRKSAPVKVPKG